MKTKHMLLVIACCLVPIIALGAIFLFKLPVSQVLFYGLVLLCPLVDYLAVDEGQLAADRERGHVFTDRILNARVRLETWLIGAETIRPLLQKLVPDAAFTTRPRLSTLSYSEPKRIGKLPRRSAVIAFSVRELYALAARLRREQGGAALVFGALSPRTRNAQVGLYQAGEVDHLVATDAIGMGLNLDIDHVVFTGLTKFDGVGPRALTAAEVGQIAGRAGRHVRDGHFAATVELGPLDRRLVEAVESHLVGILRGGTKNSSAILGAGADRRINDLAKQCRTRR